MRKMFVASVILAFLGVIGLGMSAFAAADHGEARPAAEVSAGTDAQPATAELSASQRRMVPVGKHCAHGKKLCGGKCISHSATCCPDHHTHCEKGSRCVPTHDHTYKCKRINRHGHH